jgi:hypothetical protein
MSSSEMLRRVALVRLDVSEENTASIIRATRIGELGMLAVTSNRSTLRRNSSISSQRASAADDGGGAFVRNVGCYKSHTA